MVNSSRPTPGFTNPRWHGLCRVSDGSLKLCFGTSAFILSGTDRRFDCRAVNIVPGPLTDGDSNRCELAGLYGIALLLTTLCQLFHITRGSITIACDNLEAIKILYPGFCPHPKQTNYCMIWLLQSGQSSKSFPSMSMQNMSKATKTLKLTGPSHI